MAPSLVEAGNSSPATTKPRLYILCRFHPNAVKHAQSLFDCVLYGDPEGQNWRSRATAILTKDYYITDEDLAAAPQLRVIGKQGAGLDKIDLAACERRGVAIRHTPGVNASAVAELAVGLAFTVSRMVPNLVVRQKVHGETIRKETVSGTLLSKKIVGVIGMGHIGRAAARMFHGGLQATIVGYDPYIPRPPGGTWDEIPHTRADSLEELLRISDVVTIHCPLNDETRNMISAPELKQMKKTAILINTARGGIVNEDDLAEALEGGWIWGAGIDSFVQEPPTFAQYERLWNNPRFVGTPHIGAATDETQTATGCAAVDGVYQFLMENKIKAA